MGRSIIVSCDLAQIWRDLSIDQSGRCCHYKIRWWSNLVCKNMTMKSIRNVSSLPDTLEKSLDQRPEWHLLDSVPRLSEWRAPVDTVKTICYLVVGVYHRNKERGGGVNTWAPKNHKRNITVCGRLSTNSKQQQQQRMGAKLARSMSP